MAAVRADFDIGISPRSKAKVQSELNNMFKRMSGRQTGFSINDKSFTQPLGRITASANEFTKSLEASNARVIAFGASVGVINAVGDAFKGLVLETLQFEKTLADINVVMNASTSALRGFGDELFNVARNTAQGFNVVAEAALEFSRQGLSMEETLRRTNDALILTRLTSLKATEAVSGLTAAVNAFGAAGLTTTEIIDKLAAVDVNFAVSSEDLIHALERTGAVAISAGVELDNLIGLVTALQQNTARGGSVIGNGLKTIFTRIQRPKSLKQLEEMNIAVRDLTGSVLPADRILQNIAKTFDNLSQAQQSNLVQFSAGIFQANIFRATLADLSKQQNIFSDASRISADAAGNAAVKNAALNKTLAAMVSQTKSSIQELAGSLGEIMLEDSLKGWTQGFKFLVDGLTNALDGGEGKGSDFAKGFFKGLGNVLTGPIAIAIGVVFIKLLANVAKFAGQSLKDVLGVTSEKEKLLKMENGIIEALGRNKHIQQALNNLEGDRLAQEEFMLKTIEAQTNAMQEQKRLAQGLAKPLMDRGINPDLTASNVPGGGRPLDLDGDGQYDTFGAGGVIPQAVKRERMGAIKGGYTPGAVSTMNIDGLGSVVYNKAEKVKRFPGMRQPAIMPPEKSNAGQEYRQKFSNKHGFNPYASHGLVPNYADIRNDAGNMKLMGTGQLNAPMYIEKQISSAPPGDQMYLNVKSKASSLNTKNWKIAPDSLSLGELLTSLGINNIQTTLPFDFVPGTTGQLKKLPKEVREVLTHPNNEIKGDGAESIFLGSQAGQGYTSTGGVSPGGRPGEYSIDKTIRSPNANIDAYKPGSPAVEVKAGDLDLYGVVKKSIRRYSNEAFRNTVRNTAGSYLYDERSNAVHPDMTNHQVAEELINTVNHLEEEFIVERLSELAKNGGWSPVGMSEGDLEYLIANNKLREHLRGSGFTASEADKEMLKNIGFNGGFIPDFGIMDLAPVQAASRWWENTTTALGLSGDAKSEEIDLTDSARERMMKWSEILGNARNLANDTSLDYTQRNIDTLAKMSGVGSKYIRNSLTTPRGIKAAKSSINNWELSGTGTSSQIDAEYNKYKADVESLMQGFDGAKSAGLNFENQLRVHFGYQPQISGMNAENHMDFHSQEFQGADRDKIKPGILMRKNTLHGDAYHGKDGHPADIFGGKLFRQLVKDEGGIEGSRFSGIRSLLNGKKEVADLSQVGASPYADIIASKDSKDKYVKATVSLSQLADNSKINFRNLLGLTAADDPSEIIAKDPELKNKKVRFKYWKDYVDKTKLANLPKEFDAFQAKSSGYIPNYTDLNAPSQVHDQIISTMHGGLVPNFAKDYSHSESFEGEYGRLAEMGSPLAKWAMKTVKDKEFKMIGNGMESWAIGNEEVVYKLPRPQIGSFSKSGDLEIKAWRRQMKNMVEPKVNYKVSPESKAWNFVPDSNIAIRAEKIKSHLNSKGINSLFLPNTEVLKVAGQDEFITSQERVKGNTLYNFGNEVLKADHTEGQFNLNGHKIVDHLMEKISQSTIIRDVHSHNFIAETSKKKQLLSKIDQFAPVNSNRSKPLSNLNLRGLPDESIAAIDFSSGLIPNFKKLYQSYTGEGNSGKFVSTKGPGFYFDSQRGVDDAIERRGSVLSSITNSANVGPNFSREYSISDSNLNEMVSGVYSSGNLRKLRVMSRAFAANNELPDQNDEEWEEDLVNNRGDGFDEAYYEMEARLGAHSRLLKTRKQNMSWRGGPAGTKANPQPLASYSPGGYLIPTLASSEIWEDGFTNEDDDRIRSIFSPNLNKNDYLVEREITDEYLGNQDFAEDLSRNAKNPEKAMNAARQRGIKAIGDHMGNRGLVPNFANVHLYRGQKNKSLDVPDISESLPSFASARTPDDVVAIVQDFVKRHVSGDLSGYRNKEGVAGEKKASGANSFSTSPQVADNFANSIDLTTNDMSQGQVFKKTVPSKNIFNKAKLLKILNKGSDPKSGSYPSVEKFKKEIESGAIKNWAQENGGMYLNISGVNNDPSSGKEYGQSMKQIVPPADVGYNEDRTRQIHQGEREVIQLFNNGLVPNFTGGELWDSENLKNKKKTIIDEETGTKLDYRSMSPGYAEIMHTARGVEDKKGGAFRNFNKLVGEFDSVGSGFLVPQRNGVGPTSWAKIVSMFPQLKNRIQPGLQTMGDWIMESGYDPIEIPFDSLRELKPKVKSFYNQYPDDISLQPFGGLADMDEANSFQNLTTRKVKGKGDSVVGFHNKGLVPNFLKFKKREGGGSDVPMPDTPGLFSKEEVDELKGMGYKRTDSHGWHFAKPVGLKHTPPTTSSPFGQAGPVSFDFLSRMIQHDREMYSIPNRGGDNANLDELGQSLIKGQKDSAIIGYDSTVNRMQLIEGNHRVAALGRLNKDRDKTQKFYTGMHAYVSGIKLRDQSQMDHSAGFVNQQIYPPKIPDDIIEAKKDPYRAPGQHVQGSWPPSDFGIPNFIDLSKVRELAIRGVGGEKENAQRILNKRSIKSKSMFHDEIIDSFLRNPKGEYPPGTSIVDYLIEKGYDKEQILAAAKDPRGYSRAAGGLVPNFSAVERARKTQKERVGGVGTYTGASQKEKDVSGKIYDYILGNVGGLSAGFGYDSETLGFRGSSEDYTKIFRHSKSSRNRKNLIGIAGSERMLNKILHDYMLGHTSAILEARGKFEISEDPLKMGAMARGLVPNFVDLYKPYRAEGGKSIGMENYFYGSNSQADALNYIKSSKRLTTRRSGASELRRFSFPPRVWEMLTSSSPQDIEPEMNVLPIGTRTPIGAAGAYRDTSLGRGMSEQEDFAAIALKNAYGIRPPFFDKVDSWSNGETYSTLMTNSPQFREMFNLDRLSGKNVVPNFVANFASPLRDAINREKAAGIPESMIRIDKSSQLVGPQNPMGLAVINTRDEPQGVQQGINRARSMGINPKKHGMQLPNFASGDLSPEVQEMLKDFVAEKISDGIQKALDSATNVRSAGENISSDDFEKAGFDRKDNNFKYSGGHIKKELEKGDTKESLRVNEATKTRASTFKLQAEQKLKSLEKNPTGTKDEADQITALNRVIEGLGSLGSALDEHANSMSDDTKDYIKELAKTQNGIKDASKEQVRSAAESGMGPKIKDTIKEGSGDTNQLRAAADQARAQLTKDEQIWKNSKGPDKGKALDDMQKSRENVLKLKASEDMINKETEARKNGLQQLFYFQSMISMANGFLQQMSETGAGATKVLADLGIAASDTFAAVLQARELGREASEMMGVGEGEGFSFNPFSAANKKDNQARLKADEESRNRVALGQGGRLENLRFSKGDGLLGKLYRGAGEAGTAFGRLIPALGQAYAAFTFLDSSMKFFTKSSGETVDFINSLGFEIQKGEGIMALFKNGVEKAQSRIDKLGKSAEVTAKALEAVKSSQENSIKIAELEQLGVRRTLKQDRELHELQVKEITGKTALTQARTQLTDADLMGQETATLMANQLSEVNMSGKDTEKLLRSLNVVIQRNIMLQQSRKNFEERQDDEANFTDWHTIGATIGGGALATIGTIATGGTGLLAAGAIGLTAGAASGAAGGATKDKMFSAYDISGVDPEQMDTMTRLMEGRAHEILDEYSQSLYGGDKDINNRTRTLKEKVSSYEKNMDVINRAIASHADYGPDAMISILDQLHGSEGFGEQSREELINALKDYINTGADMQDNPTHAMLGGEKLATDRGLSIITTGMKQGKGALEREDENKIQAEIDMKTVKIQERLFRNFEMELKNQSHRLDIAKKSLELDNEINTIKESLLSEHGFILNSVQIENQNARKRKSIDTKFESTKQNINAKISEQFIELSKGRADFKNISPSIVGATMSGSNKEEIKQGGMSLMAEAISRGTVDGSSLLRGTTLEGSLDQANIEGEISERFDDIGIKAEKYGVAIENARKFFEIYSKSLTGEKDGGMALTAFAESVNNVSSPLERYAILMMGELSGLASASDSGKGLAKMMETLRKSQADLESANVDYAAEIRKNEEQLRNKRISEKTLLGAGLLERQIVDDKIVEKQPEVMEKTFEGQAAYYNALNKVSKERIDILTRSKNFELSILANLQNEVTKSSESDLKSLKQAEFKNKIFATNKDLLTSAVSRALIEAEEVKLSNKNKEVKLQMISDQEYIASLTKSQIESEILDSQISQKQAEEKRKLLESTQYARILAESQAKNELESVRISRISNEQKLMAQVANGDISSLVSEELKSKLASTRTEALKTAESAIQLELNKEQTKKIQKANELLDLSNKFTAMQNAEMLASSSSENIRLGNQIGRSTDQFNMIAGARSAVDMAAMTGNPDDKAAAASQISDLERSITGKSGALTALAQKMAEVEVAASSLSADLASTMFDSARSGFGTLLTDIATGAETAGDAWENFGLGVAKQLLDRVMQNNIDKMMGNLTYAFTGVKNDPAGQQKMLASITSKQTSATKKLTEKIEALKKSLESGIGSNDKGSGELDSSLKPGSVTEIGNRLSKGFSSVTINAEDASVALNEVSTKAINLANFFEEIYKPQMKKIGEKEGSSKEVQSRYEVMQQRAARNNSNIESAERVASITQKNKTQNRIDIDSIKKRIKDLSDGASMDDIFESTLGEYGDPSKQYNYGEHTRKMKEQYAKFNYGKDFGALDQKERDGISDKVEKFYPKFADDNIGNEASAEHAKRRKDDSGVWRRDDSGMEGTVDFARGPDKAKHIFVEGDTAPIEFEPDTGFQFITDLFTEGRELTKDDYSNFETKQEELNNKKAEIETQFAELNSKQTDSEVLDGQKKIDTIRVENLKAEKEKLKQELEKTVQELSAITSVLKQSNIKKAALNTKLESLGGNAPSLPLAKTAPADTPTPVTLAPGPGQSIPVHITGAPGALPPRTPEVDKEFFGGKIQHFHDGGFVRGEPGRDKVPAMLTAGEYVIPKQTMQAFEEGGRVMSGLKGSAQMVTMALVAEEVADALNTEPEDKAPTFDMKKLNAANIGSDVNITRGDPRMSARAMAKDPVMKEYKDYLLKKASFDVQKKNEKFQERMGMLGTVVGAINSFAISQVTELLKDPISDLVAKGDNFVRGKFGDNKLAFQGLGKSHDELKGLNYRDIKTDGDVKYIDFEGKGADGINTNKRSIWDEKEGWSLPKKYAMGGQIPAMLTAGESYVPADMAKKIGYDSLNRINKEGIIQGPGGIDNVGPVGLNPGDFIIRKSSTDKLLNANPNGLRDSLMGGGFTRRATQGFYDGGMAGDSLTVPSQSLSPRRSNFDTSVSSMADREISASQEKTTNQSASSATTNNINVSVKIDSSGKETVDSSAEGDGAYQREKDLSMKIKSAVLDVIRQEKRVGGELS